MRHLGNLRKERGMNFFLRHWKGFGWGLTSIFIVLLVVGIILLVVSIVSNAMELMNLMNKIQQNGSQPQLFDALPEYYNYGGVLSTGSYIGSGGVVDPNPPIPPDGSGNTTTPIPINTQDVEKLISIGNSLIERVDSSIALIKAGIIGTLVSRIIVNGGLIARAYLDDKLSVVSSKPILFTRYAFLSVIILFIILTVAFLMSGLNEFLSIYDMAKNPIKGALNDLQVVINNGANETAIQEIISRLENEFTTMFDGFTFDTVLNKAKLLIAGGAMLGVWGLVDTAYGITTKVMFVAKGVRGNK